MSECHLTTPTWPDDQPPALPVAIAALLAEGQDRLRIQRERDALAARKVRDAHEAKRQEAWDSFVASAKHDLGPGLSEIVNWAMPTEEITDPEMWSIAKSWRLDTREFYLAIRLPAFTPIMARYILKDGCWVRAGWDRHDEKAFRWKVIQYALDQGEGGAILRPCDHEHCHLVPDIGLALALAQEAWVEKAKLLCEIAK